MKVLIGFFVTLTLLMATAYQTSGPAAAQAPARSCFTVRSVRGFRSVNNRTVYVRASGNDVFALELFSPCNGVNWAHTAELRTRGASRVCEGRANWVTLYVRRAGGGRQRCSVSNVHRLTPYDITRLPLGARP